MSSTSTTPPPTPYYGYAASYYEAERAQRIERTKTGLLLIAIGFFIAWVPFVGIVGGILEFIGAILVILGRQAFGKDHSRNIMLSIIIFIITIVATIVGVFVAVFSAIANYRYNGTNPVTPPNIASSFTGTFYDIILIGIAFFGIAEVLFIYALQKKTGRILLWCGYSSTIAASGIEFFVLNKIPYLSSIIFIVPGISYGYAYYLARDRIVRGEIPAPAQPLN